MTGFICHDDYLNKTAILSDEQLGRLIRACMKYHATGEVEPLGGVEGMAFEFIRFDIDKTEKAYQEKCEINRRNRLAKQTGDNDRQPSSTNDDDRQQPSIIKEKKRHIKDNTNSNSRFAPPTLEEVTAYCKERNNQIDPQQFIDFYSSKGWKVGNQSMKDWRACIRTWERRDRSPVKKVIACDFDQRDYSNLPDRMMSDLAREMEDFKASGA